MSLINKLLQNSSIKGTSVLQDSKILNGLEETISTKVPMINVALSASMSGGLAPGLLMIAGPSKHFKTGFTFLIASEFQKKYKEGIVLFYDSEFGTTNSYFSMMDIDKNRVVHSPLTDLEQLKFDISKQLSVIDAKDKVCIVIDSIGSLASKKEVDDALDGKSVADMSRAKQIKSLFRIVTPHLTLKKIPMIAINHTYKEQSLFPRDIVSGGTGPYYSANDIWILGRQQEKDSNGVDGYKFIINIEKSRRVREKSKIPVTIKFNGGIAKYSGFLEMAEEGGYARKPKKGQYELLDPNTGELLFDRTFTEKALFENAEVWEKLRKETDFEAFVYRSFSLDQMPNVPNISTDDVLKEGSDGE